jgi:hypothetical protein
LEDYSILLWFADNTSVNLNPGQYFLYCGNEFDHPTVESLAMNGSLHIEKVHIPINLHGANEVIEANWQKEGF